VLSDVLHHVRPLERPSLLSAIRRAMVPGGSLAVKDWIISSSPIHWLSWFADRYLTGDDVEFFTPQSMQALLIGAFGPDAVRGKSLVRPWSNNIAYHIRQCGNITNNRPRSGLPTIDLEVVKGSNR